MKNKTINSNNHFCFKKWRITVLIAFTVHFLTAVFSQNCNNLPVFDVTFSNQTLANTQLHINKNIRITGTVTFNSNVSFLGCTVLIDPGGVVTMKKIFTAQKSPNGTSTVIFGCQAMWNSIVIASGASARLSDCTIRDGEQGIVFQNGYKANISLIQRCTFDRNLVGITANGVSNFTFSVFNGNVIRWGLMPQIMLAPYTANAGLTGISVINSTGSLGTTGAVNTFSGLSAGINMTGSSLTINNCSFRFNRKVYGPPNHPGATFFYSGAGIYAFNSSVNIAGIFTNGFSCTFDNNRTDIYSFRTVKFYVENALFSNPLVTSIIISGSTQPNDIDIIDNDFSLSETTLLPTESWVQVERAGQGGGTNTYIFKNHFTIARGQTGSPNGTRIMNFTAQSGATDICLIDDNTIDCHYGNPSDNTSTQTIDAIRIFGDADRYVVQNNHINYDDVANPATLPNADVITIGIGVLNNNGINNVIGAQNIMQSLFYPGVAELRRAWIRCGTHILSSPNVKVCDNYVNEAVNHYHFLENSNNIEFGKNTTTGRGNFGLVVDNGPIPSNLHHRRNLWLGTYDKKGANHNIFALGILWYVDPSVSGYYPPSQNPTAWFQQQPDDKSIHFCDLGSLSNDDGSSAGTVAKQFIDGGYAFSGNTAIWDFEVNVLGQLIRFPSALSGNATAQQYYNNREGTVLWSLANGRQMLHNASVPTISEEAAIRQLYDQLTERTDLLLQVEVEEGIDTTTVDSMLQMTKENLLLNCQAINDQIYTLLTVSQNTRAAQVTAAQSYIANIQAVTALELNYKTLLNLMAQKALGQDWSDADLGILRTIAHLCPDDFGDAVSMAREMLPSEESNRFPAEGDDPYCEGERGITSLGFTEIEGDINIYPNPGSHMIFMDFSSSFSGNIQIHSTDGQLKFSRDYQNAVVVPLGVLDFPNGVYWVKFRNIDGKVVNKKALIVH